VPSRAVVAAIATAVVLAVLVVTQLPRWPYATVRTERLPASLTRLIPGGDPVGITYPYGYGSFYTSPLVWQANADYSYRYMGGYAFHLGQDGRGSDDPNPLVPEPKGVIHSNPRGIVNGMEIYILNQQFLPILKNVPLPPLPLNSELVATTRATISKYHIRVIIVDRSRSGAANVIDLFRRALGTSPVSSGTFSMWIVPQAQGVGT